VGSIYLTEIRELGPEVPDFMEAGLLILFQTGAPPELAEISVLHEPIEVRNEPPKPGDVLNVGDLEFRITAVGSKAWENVLALGHAVLKFDGSEVAELPGEIRLQNEGFEGLSDLVKPGTRIEIRDDESREALDVA
jgi:PTS system glucitol/sorbitol-specific IIA component